MRTVQFYLCRRVDSVVVNTGTCPTDALARYAAEGAYPVEADLPEFERLVVRVLIEIFFAAERLICHDGERVVLALWPELHGSLAHHYSTLAWRLGVPVSVRTSPITA